MPTDTDWSAALEADSVDARRDAARECRAAATRGEALDWDVVAALAEAATAADRELQALARSALVEARSGSGDAGWSEETARLRELLERIAADDDTARNDVAADPGSDEARAVLVEMLARARKTSVFAAPNALGRALDHEDPAVRKSLASAVFANGASPRNGAKDAIAALSEHLTAADAAVRAAVTTAVGTASVAGRNASDYPEAAHAVVDGLADSDSRVRHAALEAFNEESRRRLEEDHGGALADRYVRLVVACRVHADESVRRAARDRVHARDVLSLPDWQTTVLPRLADALPDGRGDASLLTSLAEEDPGAIVPYVDTLLEPGATVENRAAGARVVTTVLGSDHADVAPADRVVAALCAAVDAGRDRRRTRRALDALDTVATHQPEAVLDRLDVLTAAFADPNRKVRNAAADLLRTLGTERPDAVPAPIRALAAADDDEHDDPLLALWPTHDRFVRQQVHAFVDAVTTQPAVEDELYYRDWTRTLAKAAPAAIDAALEPLAAAIDAGGDAREAAASLCWTYAGRVDLAPILGSLREAITEGPSETPVGVLVAFAHTTEDRPGLAESALPAVAHWLTWHRGRSPAPRGGDPVASAILARFDDATLAAYRDALPEAARALLDADALEAERDPLSALGEVAPTVAADALRGIVDRYLDDGVGSETDLLDALFAVHETAPSVACDAVVRLDDDLDHYGRRLDLSEPFLGRVEDGPTDLAAAGLGLLLTALDLQRRKFRNRIPPVLQAVAEHHPDAGAPHADALLERLDDDADVADAARDLLAGAVQTQTTGVPEAVRDRLLAVDPDGDGASAAVASVRALAEGAPEHAERAVRPLALDAIVDAAGGWDALDPTYLAASVQATTNLATGDPAAFDGQTVVVTGAVDDYTRDDLHDALEAAGANPTSSVSGNTDLLVVGSDPGTSKREAALAEAVPMVDADAVVQALD